MNENLEEVKQETVEQPEVTEEATEAVEAPAPEETKGEETIAEEVPKTFTQEDVDKIKNQTIARERTRADKLQKAVLEQYGIDNTKSYQSIQQPIAQPNVTTTAPVYQQPTYNAAADTLAQAAVSAGLGPEDMAKMNVQGKELEQSNPALYAELTTNFEVQLGREGKLASVLNMYASAADYDGGVEALGKIWKTEEGKNQLFDIAKLNSKREQAKRIGQLIENSVKKPEPIVAEKRTLTKTGLPPGSGKSVSNYDNLTVAQQIDLRRQAMNK